MSARRPGRHKRRPPKPKSAEEDRDFIQERDPVSGPFLIYFAQFGVLFKLNEMPHLRRSIKEDQLNTNSVGRIRRREQIVVDENTILGALSRRVTLGPH
jgi:hypothetical protein